MVMDGVVWWSGVMVWQCVVLVWWSGVVVWRWMVWCGGQV